MKRVFQVFVFIIAFSLAPMRVVASPEIDRMSDIEVSEYAVRMSAVLEAIQQSQLCAASDIQCVRSEFARNGISYDDKKSVQKRLVLMIGSIY